MARHLLDGIDGIYDRLETNPFQFPLSRDAYLANKGYQTRLSRVYDRSAIRAGALRIKEWQFGQSNIKFSSLLFL